MNGEKTSLLNDGKPFWHFRKMQAGEENQNPIQGEFFTPDTLGELCDVLVRESIQNSLDAQLKDVSGPARVKIHFGDMDARTPKRKVAQEYYFNGLWDHISAQESGIRNLQKKDGLLQYICFEDFNTSGLEGDPSFDDVEAPLDEHERNDFFYFWRNIARSGKGAKDLGSWGVGKQVFAASSYINTYFGFSVRRDDFCPSLMGKGILKIHHAPHKCAPYGYWGVFGEDRSDFAMPAQGNHEILESFANDFNLQRDGESGLSVIVPFCRLELLDSKSLCAAVIKHYFFPILTGRLVVQVANKSCPGKDITEDWTVIDQSSIEQVASVVLQDQPDFVALLELAAWAVNLETEDHLLPVKIPDLGKTPDWGHQKFQEDILEEARRQLEANGRVAFRVPIRIKASNSKIPQCCWMKVLFGRAPKDSSTPAKYIRQGIDIANAKASKLGRGVVGLLEIDDPCLGGMLRMAEPPAHDKWETRSGRLEDYEKGAKTVRFVIHAPHKLWAILSAAEAKRDPDLLKDIFYVDLGDIDSPGGSKKQGSKKKPGDPEDVEVPENTMRRYSPIVMPISEESLAGFQLSAPSGATHTPRFLTVKCAYETARGNPFKNYSPLDFKLDKLPIQIRCEGLHIKSHSGNVLEAEILSADYLLAITGFDTNRDLRTSVQAELEGEEAEQEDEA